MSTEHKAPPISEEELELNTGDRMTQKEFHRVYQQMPESFRAELIGGIVYVGSPLRRRHGTYHVALANLLGGYEGDTPGTEAGDNTTVILSDEGEPQPDLYLRILPEFGGQSQTDSDDYVVGAPEFLGEIAASSRSLDLHSKRDDYTNNGVREYMVLCVREKQLRWFDLRAGQELQPEPDGVYRVHCFPGLWIHGPALLDKNYKKMTEVLHQGLACAEHQEFVKKLAASQSGE